MTIDIAKLEALLEKVYERIDGEDYIGTCGCVCGSQPPENSLREDYCPCLREHNVVLAEIAAMKNALPELLEAARDGERWRESQAQKHGADFEAAIRKMKEASRG